MNNKSDYKISVHLIVYNGEIYLPYCLTGLINQTERDFFLLIIDNASIDNSRKIIDEFLYLHPTLSRHARIVRNNKNLGFGRAHNQALQWTNSDYVMFLNQDVVLHHDYLFRLKECLEASPQVGAVQGKIFRWRENINEHLIMPPQFKQAIIDSGGLAIKKSRYVYRFREGEVNQDEFKEAIEVFGVDGAAPLYRRLALESVSVNGEVLDESFVSYKEDVDLAWRLRLAGWESWLVTSGVAWHDRSLSPRDGFKSIWQSRRKWPSFLRVYSCRNHWLTLLKNDYLNNFIRHLPYILWYEFKKFIYRLLFEPIVLIKSLGQFFKLAPKTLSRRRQSKSQRIITSKEIRKWFL